MVEQGADAKEDLETAQTTYKSAIADRSALEAQEQAAEDAVKVAESQLTVARSQVAANQAQVKQSAACAPRPDRSRSHEHHGAGRRRGRLAKRRTSVRPSPRAWRRPRCFSSRRT
jgi:hypothetical protein